MVPFGLWVVGAGSPAKRRMMKRKKVAKRKSRRRADGVRGARLILGHWRSEGTEPCRVCGGEGGGWRGSRNLQVVEEEQVVNVWKHLKNEHFRRNCFSFK